MVVSFAIRFADSSVRSAVALLLVSYGILFVAEVHVFGDEHPVAAKKTAPPVTSVAFSADDRSVFAAVDTQVVRIDIGTQAELARFSGAEFPINAVAVDRDGATVVAAEGEPGVDGFVRVWNLSAPGEPKTLSGHTDSVYGIAVHPGGAMLASTSYDKLVMLWSLDGGQLKGGEPRILKHHTAAVYSVAFNSDGKVLGSVAADQTLKLWNTETGERLVTASEATKGLNAVAFHPHSNRVASGGIDRVLRLYSWGESAGALPLAKSAVAHDAPILAIVWPGDGSRIFTSSEDKTIKSWDAATLQPAGVLGSLPDWPVSLAASSDGKQLAVGMFNGELWLVDAATLKRTAVLIAPETVGRTTSATAAANTPNPPTPRLDAVSPPFVVRGKTTRLTLFGQNIAAADGVFAANRQLSPRLIPGDALKPNQVEIELAVPAEWVSSPELLRLHTPLGSTGAKGVYVVPFEVTGEKEPNNIPAESTPVTLPATLHGSIASRGDVDQFALDVLEEADLVAVVETAGINSSLTPKLTLKDAAGAVVATATRQPGRANVLLAARHAKPGRYTLAIEDRNNSGGGGHTYLVSVGQFAYIESVFPSVVGHDHLKAVSGGRSITVMGLNLPAELQSQPADVYFETLATPRGPTLNRLVVSRSAIKESRETEPNDAVAEATSIDTPGGVSGRLHHADSSVPDVDVYTFVAEAGTELVLEVKARRLGSPVDSYIEVLDARGNPVETATLRAVAETYTVLRDHDSRSGGIRMHNWDTFQVRDHLLIGGEVVRIRKLPLGPDEDVAFFDRSGQRLAWLGSTSQAHAINSPVYQVEVHPPGSTFPPNGLPVRRLYAANDDGGPDVGADSRLAFTPPASGKYFVRVSDVRGQSGPEFTYHLSVRTPIPDFSISLDPENPNVPRGGSLPVTVNVDRRDGFHGWIDVRMDGLPSGFTATPVRIDPESSSGVIVISAAADAVTPGPYALERLHVTGRYQGLSGVVLERLTQPAFGGHQLTAASPPDLIVAVEPASISVSPGQSAQFSVHVDRRNGFTGRVPVDVLNLPFGLRVLDVGLNGVLVTEDSSSRTFTVQCDPWGPPGRWQFTAAGRVEAKGERHASPLVEIEVVPAATAAR